LFFFVPGSEMQHISTPTKLQCQQNASNIATITKSFCKKIKTIAKKAQFRTKNATGVAIFD